VRRIFLFLLAVFVAAATVGRAEVASLEDVWALFPESGDVAVAYDDAGRAALEAAIDFLERELGVSASFDATSEEAYAALDVPAERKSWVNRLSQAYYTLGDVFLRGESGAKTAFLKGQLWGLKSLRMSSDFATEETRHGFIEAVRQETDVAALYWTYGNWARKDEFDPLGAIARNDPPKLQALIERALEVDETYMAYGSYRALAAFWGGLPPLPLYAYGQNLPRTLSYICPVIREPEFCAECEGCPVDPEADAYFENRLIFAQYYLMEKELWTDAARILRELLAEPVGEQHPLYNAFCQELAAELLREVEQHLE
jgi:hypothetical protein